MPIYEYQCSKCGKVHEIWQKISESPLTKCPDCKGKMERLISATAFALKGSGWYKTDYERKGKKSSDKKEKSDSSEKKSESKSDAKSDSKPDSGSSPSGDKPKGLAA